MFAYYNLELNLLLFDEDARLGFIFANIVFAIPVNVGIISEHENN
jgi:hypothetical protein